LSSFVPRSYFVSQKNNYPEIATAHVWPVSISSSCVESCTDPKQVYDRCKSSAAEFRDLSREVSSMHFVIKAIESSWNAHDLAPYQEYELASLVDGCREVMKDLEQKIDKYQSLGSN